MSLDEIKQELDLRFPGFTEACKIVKADKARCVYLRHADFNDPQQASWVALAIRYAGHEEVPIKLVPWDMAIADTYPTIVPKEKVIPPEVLEAVKKARYLFQD